MSAIARWGPVVGVTLVAALFSWFNRGERVIVDLGVAKLYRVPFTVVVFIAFLAGMVSMLLLSLRHDLRVRRALERHGLDPSGHTPVLAAPDPPPSWAVVPPAGDPAQEPRDPV